MNHTTKHRWTTLLVVAAALLASPIARADVVTDWNITATDDPKLVAFNGLIGAAEIEIDPATMTVKATAYEWK
jgi:hypothetical protein